MPPTILFLLNHMLPFLVFYFSGLALLLLLHLLLQWCIACKPVQDQTSLDPNEPYYHSITIPDDGDCPTTSNCESSDSGSEGGEDRQCCMVCLRDVKVEDVTRRVLVECGHAFHVGCIEPWIKACRACPICRTPVPFDGGSGEAVKGRVGGTREDLPAFVGSYGARSGEVGWCRGDFSLSLLNLF